MKKIDNIQYPEGIILDRDVDRNLKMTLERPWENMQDDCAAFEAWSLIFKTHGVCNNIVLSFTKLNMSRDKESYFEHLSSSHCHYFRFLYRLKCFSNQFSTWFVLSQEAEKEVNLFFEMFLPLRKLNNVPMKDSEYNERKGLEHVLEKAFVGIPEFRTRCGIRFEVHDQLPNGLFRESVSEDRRIFNTGFFDLWGTDSTGEFHVFELKTPKNVKAGIVSELYFYANFANDLLNGKSNIFISENHGIDFRQYSKFTQCRNKSVSAHFLVKEIHPRLAEKFDEVLILLNTKSEIKYHISRYSLNDQDIENIKRELKTVYENEI